MTTPATRPTTTDDRPEAPFGPALERRPADSNGNLGTAEPLGEETARADGQMAPTVEAEPAAVAAPAPSRRRRRLLFLLPILLVVGAIAITISYRYWYESTFFVITDNAQVTGDLVQVGSLNAGRVLATRVDVGDQVRKGQDIALIGIPQQVGSTPFGSAPKLDETGTSDSQVAVRAPLNGVVAARMGYVGGTVAAGQPLFALVDPGAIYVKANIEETKVARVQPGQPVEVHVDALDRSFPGRVESITPASAATFSLLPSQNVSGNFTKVTQLVPVKILVESGGTVLPLGTSAEVRVQVQQPGGGLPWRP